MGRGHLPALDRHGAAAGCHRGADPHPRLQRHENRTPGTVARRLDGDLYRAQWDAAAQSDADWVVITSFNEWHEGSDIEPSKEHGEKYLRLTRKYAEQFKQHSRQAGDAKPADAKAGAGLSQAARAKLKQKLTNKRVGMLGGLNPVGVFLAGQVGIEPEQVTWDELAAGEAKQFDLLIFGGGEEISAPGEQADKVIDSLKAYLQSGGKLALLPSGPMPMHRSGGGDTLQAMSKLEMPLRVAGSDGVRGWEDPPENGELTFTSPEDRLRGLSETWAFPETGDLRWRPLDASELPDNANATPLLVLENEKGESLGQAATIVTRAEGGRVGYVWHRLLAGPHRDKLIAAMLSRLAEPSESEGEGSS